MRTTMQTIHQSLLANLNRITSDLNLVNAQISSGKLMSKPSDDPVNLVGALGLRSNLAEVQQYQRNLDFGENFITSSESALRGIQELTIRGKELAISAVNGIITPENRANMAEEVRNLFEQAMVLGNTQVNGKYIFGGYRTTGYTDAEPAPFVAGLDDGYRMNGQAPTGPLPLNAGELAINGIAIGAAADDSAAAKAAAINAAEGQTGVTAKISAATHTAAGSVQTGAINAGDLLINGVDIFPAGAAVLANDSDNVLVDAINAKNESANTGVVASRNSSGQLILTAIDGRNIEVETSGNGATRTGLAAGMNVHYGSLQLYSDRVFTLEGASGLEALGLDGEDADGDGTLVVQDLAKREGFVRYTGDRDHDLAIKVGARSTLEISKNGQEALKETGVFTVLKNLENALRGTGYQEAKSARAASEIDLAQIGAGSFTVTVTDHENSQAEASFTIPVEPGDSLDDIAARINNLPNMTASFDDDGYLLVGTADEDRFTLSMEGDTSGFLKALGLGGEDLQIHAIEKALADLGGSMDELTNHISDFGARGNRIDAQRQILSNLELATAENLSSKEDTDMLAAITTLRQKETAYQAALAAAAKTMQLSLVDYL